MKPFLSIKQREGNRWQFFMIHLSKKPGHCYFQTENCFSGSNDYTFWLMLPNNFQESRKKKSLKTTEIREVRENQLGPKYHERISIQKLTRGQEIKIISQKNQASMKAYPCVPQTVVCRHYQMLYEVTRKRGNCLAP